MKAVRFLVITRQIRIFSKRPVRQKLIRRWSPFLTAMFLPVAVVSSGLGGQAPVPSALETASQDFTQLERKFFYDLSDGVLDDFDRYDAFLIASNIVHARQFYGYQSMLRKIRRRVLTGMDKTADPFQLAKTLLFRLHDQVFRQYIEDAATAGTLIDQGQYNCLSSTILYYLLARELGGLAIAAT